MNNLGMATGGGGLGGLAALSLGINSPRILLVEDDRCLRRLLARVLRFEGYAVVTAGNGVEALKILQEQRVSLVVTDLCMPGMDGGELTRQLEHHYPGTPVIVISGECDAWDRFELRARHNLSRMLVKPITVETLLKEVSATLQECNFDLSKTD
ncbi:MAG: hypothetical protein B9S32_15360 [Verrucomicrobia bacterium Tous-C9LFEB]|nr:MAG: hypothetical protein B9S32_15360 [Verrucomicrobia bacterium Tous-C9LFEB]